MNGRSIKWFPLVLFSLLALLTFWLDQKVEMSAKSDEEKRSHQPDFFIDNFKVSSLGEDGMQKQLLLANKLLHYPDDDSTDLEKPRLMIYSPGRADISLSSDKATVSKNGDDLYLTQNVLLRKMRYEAQNGFDLQTEYLHVNPDLHQTDTDKPVVISNPQMTIHAVGMTFNDSTRVLNLLSQVRGIYEKNP